MLALRLHTHAIVVAAIIDPLRHVATAGRVVRLEWGLGGGGEDTAKPLLRAAVLLVCRGEREGGRSCLEAVGVGTELNLVAEEDEDKAESACV